MLQFKADVINTIDPDDKQDFFGFAGIWEGRDITTESLRIGAWRIEQKINDIPRFKSKSLNQDEMT